MNKTLFLMCFMSILTLSSCIRVKKFYQDKRGHQYHSEFHWKYDNHDFALTFVVEDTFYDFYNRIAKNYPNYDFYTYEDVNHLYLAQFANALKQQAAPYHFNKQQMAEYLLSFVQSIPYTSDPRGDEYSRFPLIWIVDQASDCEDYSEMYCGLASYMGYNCCIIHFKDIFHTTAGIEVEDMKYEGRYSCSGHHYAIAEGTNPRVKLGEDLFQSEKGDLIEIEPVTGNGIRALDMRQFSHTPSLESSILSGDAYWKVEDKLKERFDSITSKIHLP